MKQPKISIRLRRKELQLEQFSPAVSAIFEIFNSSLYDGLWHSELLQREDFYISEKFRSLLNYNSSDHFSWQSLLLPKDLIKFQKQLDSFTNATQFSFTEIFNFLNKSGEVIRLQVDFYTNPDLDSENQALFLGFKNISTQQLNDLKAKEHFQRSQEILNGSTVGMWEYNLVTDEAIFNQSWASILGYTIEELEILNTNIWVGLTHPDDIEKSQELLNAHIENKSSYFLNEVRMKHKDGHWVWIVHIGKVLNYSYDGKPEWLGGIHYDVSERKNGELLLTRYKELLEGVNEAAEIGIWDVDLKTKKVYWSDEIKKMAGVPIAFQPTLEDAMGFFKEGESRDSIVACMENAVKKGINFDIEVEIVTIQNKTLWTRAIGVTEYSNGFCTRLFGFFQNIHEKTLAINELANKEELFRKTFSHAPVGMAIVDLKGKISQINKNLCEFLGYSEAQLLQTNFNRFSHSKDKNLTTEFIDELLLGARESFKLDKRYIHKDGSTIWGQISVSSVRNIVDVITHFVVQVQDITERKKNELLLLNSQDLLERSNYVAKIGSWEIDVKDHTVSWSDSLSKILNTRENLIPTFEESIKYFTSGKHEEIVKTAIKRALEKGINYDIELLINTYNEDAKWVRMIGISEFEDGKCKRLYGLVQDIDHIKKSQVVIANKEEQWRTTFNHAKAGIALINFSGNADNVNQSLCDIFGYTMAEMQKVGIKDISLPEDLESNIDLMNNLIHGENEYFSAEKRFLHKKGHVIWVNLSMSSVKNDFGQFTHMVAQLVDITDSKNNQLLLNKYKDILERSNRVAKIGSWELNPENNLLFWSKNLIKLLGSTDYEPHPLNESISNYALAEDQERLTGVIQDAIQLGKNFDIEIQLKTEKGVRWMRMIGVSDFENNSCNLVHGLIQDIDDFKNAQLEILLREEEFRQTFWHAPIGMALLDLSGRIVRVNPSLCENFGYTEQEMLEVDSGVITHPDDAPLTNAMLQQVINGERESFQQEKRYFHKNQNLVWAILSLSSVKNDKGQTTHFVAQVNDITDKKLLTESLKEHNNRLQNYAHIVSHNLRSHTGNLSMLLELSEINQKQGFEDEIFDHIRSASNNMSETVQHLSDIVEINNLIKNTLAPHNLRKRVKKALQNLQAPLNEVNGEVFLKVDKELMVYAISSYIDSVVLNILTNAIKYRSPHRLLKIKIKAKKIEGYTYLKIADNGLGIDLEKHGSKIFGMYKTFHDHKNARGIGLFMSKNQMEAMDGRIEVKSKVDVGTTFIIYFRDELD